MHNKLSTRWAIVIFSLLLGALWISPNFIKYSKDSFLGKSKLSKGLDIQGGMQLVMGVDVDAVVRERAARMVKSLDAEFKDNKISFQSVAVAGENKTNMQILTGGAANKAAIVKQLEERYPSTLQIVTAKDDAIDVRYFDAVLLDMKKQVVSQAIEVIRNRIDEFGVSEPSIVAQGSDRILIQLPGLQDSLRAKELINRTAKLDFRVVSSEIPNDKLQSLIDEAEKKGSYKLGGEGGLLYQAYVKKLNEDISDKLPKDSKIVFEKSENAASLEVGRRPYVIKTDSALGGSELEDAFVKQDEMGKPEVVFNFSMGGRKMFAELTGKAAGGLIAIVLDDVVKSAPRVERQIDSDSARITLGASRDFNATLNEATFIATSLRAGALPAALEQLEERVVGPSLGTDSIKKAQNATAIGCLLVFLFMLIYYRTLGLVADITLVMNVFLTMAVLTTLGATLTLPGVAGIALTVGMAVDANVIIYERIKEELRKGASQIAAIKDGYNNAFSAIFDSNLTTVLTCVALGYYGTGPIRGFAVSLSIGIAISMFTAIFVSHVIIDTLVLKFKINVLSVK